MNAYARLQKLAGEKIFEVATLKVQAASLIRDAVNVCVQTDKIPSKAFTCQDAREDKNFDAAIERARLIETVKHHDDGSWRCRLFVTIKYESATGAGFSGSIVTVLEPRIVFDAKGAHLGLVGHKGVIVFAGKGDRSQTVREYASKLTTAIEEAIRGFSAMGAKNPTELGFHTFMVPSKEES